MAFRRLFLLLAVSVLPSSLFANTLYFPQVVFGGGYSTTVTITNTGNTRVTSAINFYGQNGAARTTLSRPISLPPDRSVRVYLPNSGPLTVVWGELAAVPGTVQGLVSFDQRTDFGALITSADVPAIEAANNFRFPVDVTSSTSTGIAIANVQAAGSVNASLRLMDENGSQTATVNDVRLNALGARRQAADLLTSFFPQLAGTVFRGTLVIEASAAAPPNSLAAVVVSMKEGTLSPLPVAAGGSTGSAAGNTLYFPQVVFGGGYATNFVIMNTGSATASSRVSFYDQRGVVQTSLAASINIPVGGSTRFMLPNSGPLTVVWAEVATAPGTIQGMATVERRSDIGVLMSTSAILGIEGANRFLFPVEVLPVTPGGLAIANVKDGGPMNVTVRFFTDDGFPVVRPADLRLTPLGARSQIADYVKSILSLPPITYSLKGTLIIEAPADAPPNSLAAAALTLKEPGTPNDRSASLLSVLPRDLTAAEQRSIEAANSFSLALWSKINSAERAKNVFVSPLSALLCLGMVLNGAANRTFDEMRSALQFGAATEQEINEGSRSLIALLTTIDPAVKMQIANSVWYKNGFPFLDSFFEISKQYFDAEVRGLNFGEKASVDIINNWVNSKTNNKIPTIIEEIDPMDVMFLINAIYFNGPWRDKFDAAQTRAATFLSGDGTSQPVSLMHRLDSLSYTESSTYQAVDLPYGNSAFTMTVVLPNPNSDVESVAASLTASALQSLTSSLRSRDVDLYLPKLRLSYERQLKDDLKALGMISAFAPNGADFTRMSPEGKSLFISFVKQKTFVDISEEGTEAAAATIGGPQIVSPPPPPVLMRVDHPYIFMIRERLSGTLLFMGKIVRMP